MARLTLGSLMVAALSGCVVPHSRPAVGPAVVTTNYVSLASEGGRGCFFLIQELQPHEEHDFDVVRRLTVSVGDKDGKLRYAAAFSRGTPFQYNGVILGNSGYPLFPETMRVGDHLKTFPPTAGQKFTGATPDRVVDSGDETTVDPMLRSLAASKIAVSYVVASTRQHESWTMPSLVNVANIDRLQLFRTCVAALRAPTQHPAIAP